MGGQSTLHYSNCLTNYGILKNYVFVITFQNNFTLWSFVRLCHETQLSLPQGKVPFMLAHWSILSRYLEVHVFWYLSPDSTSGCQGLSNEPSNTSESKRVKFYVFSTGGTKGNKKFSWGPPCRKNIKFHSITFRCVWWLVWKPLASWGGIWAQISKFMTFEVARWFWSMWQHKRVYLVKVVNCLQVPMFHFIYPRAHPQARFPIKGWHLAFRKNSNLLTGSSEPRFF